ncbi:hypothetical protein C8Q76DRAFT_224418 [Earliella scabrosa]|nr:hypothetical protein C8Q76DRAFT_224418 [Earliella scabrosa]
MSTSSSLRSIATRARVPSIQRVRGSPTGMNIAYRTCAPMSTSALNAPVGVARALAASPDKVPAGPTLFTQEFSLADRVALVTGANSGIGLESALALIEAGARSVYCLDVVKQPSDDWSKVRELVDRMGLGHFEYVCGDVRDQEGMWKVGQMIGDREGRMDVCVAAAGILKPLAPSLDYPGADFDETMDVNLKGVLFSAQGAGRQMARFKNGGSIIMIGSICGSCALEPQFPSVAYHSSKSGILQLARSMACDLGSQRIRVNSISPGFIRTRMVQFVVQDPAHLAKASTTNPLGRLGNPEELRGAVAWLASDASSFCTGSDIVVSGGHHAW